MSKTGLRDRHLALVRNWFWDTPREERLRLYASMLFDETALSTELDAIDVVVEHAIVHRERVFNVFFLAERSASGRAAEAEMIGAFVSLCNGGSFVRMLVVDHWNGDDFVGSVFSVELLWERLLSSWAVHRAADFLADGSVYLLGGGGFYKIGRAKRVDTRVKQLGILLPYPVEVVHHFQCQHHEKAERALHEMFAAKRTNGEWFDLSDDDVALIRNIVRMRGSDVEWDDFLAVAS